MSDVGCRKTFSKKIAKVFDVSSSRLFLFYRGSGCFSALGVKKYKQTKQITKTIVSKSLFSKIQNRFFSIFFNHVFGRFSVRGVQKHDNKISEKKSDLGPFWASDPPTHNGGH
jgi:hypothetical protein